MIEKIKNSKLSFVEIEKEFDLPKGYVSKINLGNKFKLATESYPLRSKKEINKQEILEFMLNNKTMTQKQLADYFSISISTIKRIKAQNINKF